MVVASFFELDASRCKRCGLCVDDCLPGALVRSADGTPTPTPDAETRCFRCQHCFSICPAGAIRWRGLDPNLSESIAPLPSPVEEFNLIRKRRSVRAYLREDVDPEVLDALHASMAFVPTGCNDHCLFFSYSDVVQTTDSFREAARQSALRITANPDAIPPRLAFLKNARPALENGIDVFFRNAPCFVAIAVRPEARDAHIDPYIAGAYFELLACSYGLGICWDGMATELFLYDDELRAHLNISNDFKLKIVLAFGKPSVAHARASQPVPYGRARAVPFSEK